MKGPGSTPLSGAERGTLSPYGRDNPRSGRQVPVERGTVNRLTGLTNDIGHYDIKRTPPKHRAQPHPNSAETRAVEKSRGLQSNPLQKPPPERKGESQSRSLSAEKPLAAKLSPNYVLPVETPIEMAIETPSPGPGVTSGTIGAIFGYLAAGAILAGLIFSAWAKAVQPNDNSKDAERVRRTAYADDLRSRGEITWEQANEYIITGQLFIPGVPLLRGPNAVAASSAGSGHRATTNANRGLQAKPETEGKQKAQSGKARGLRRGLTIDLKPEQVNRLVRAEAAKKWSDLSGRDRTSLGKRYGYIIEELSRKIASGGRAKTVLHWDEIDKPLIDRLKKEGGKVVITQGRLAGGKMRFDIGEIDFDAHLVTIIDLAPSPEVGHLKVSARYGGFLQELTGFNTDVYEMYYVGENGELLDELAVFKVELKRKKT